MKLVLNLSLSRFKGLMCPEEHADMVSALLNQQVFSPEEISISPSNPNPDATLHVQLLLKLKQKIREMVLSRINREVSRFHKGALVSSLHSKIVQPCPKGASKDSRKPVYGNVVCESEYFPGYWLIHFFASNEYYYCLENAMKFESPSGVTTVIDTTNQRNPSKPCNIQIHCNNKEQDLILFFVMVNKLHRTPAYREKTINEVAQLFQPMFPWMSRVTLKKFVTKHRKLMLAKNLLNVINRSNSHIEDETIQTPTKSQATTSPLDRKRSCSKPSVVTPGEYILQTYVSIGIRVSLPTLTVNIHCNEFTLRKLGKDPKWLIMYLLIQKRLLQLQIQMNRIREVRCL